MSVSGINAPLTDIMAFIAGDDAVVQGDNLCSPEGLVFQNILGAQKAQASESENVELPEEEEKDIPTFTLAVLASAVWNANRQQNVETCSVKDKNERNTETGRVKTSLFDPDVILMDPVAKAAACTLVLPEKNNNNENNTLEGLLTTEAAFKMLDEPEEEALAVPKVLDDRGVFSAQEEPAGSMASTIKTRPDDHPPFLAVLNTKSSIKERPDRPEMDLLPERLERLEQAVLKPVRRDDAFSAPVPDPETSTTESDWGESEREPAVKSPIYENGRESSREERDSGGEQKGGSPKMVSGMGNVERQTKGVREGETLAMFKGAEHPLPVSLNTKEGHSVVPVTDSIAGSPPEKYQHMPLGRGMETVLEFLKDEGIHQARVVVDPPALGRIDIRLQSTGSGIEAVFHVDNDNLRLALQGQLDHLKQALLAQGVQVSGLTVDIRSGDERERSNLQPLKKLKRVRESGQEEEVSVMRLDLEKGLLHWVG